jgi:hypothetical protein
MTGDDWTTAAALIACSLLIAFGLIGRGVARRTGGKL